MGLEIKSPISQGPAVGPNDQIGIDAPPDKKTGEQEGSTTAGNAQTTSNTVQAMKQAATETKGSMNTSGRFRQQELANQLEKKISQNEGGSAGLLKSPIPQ